MFDLNDMNEIINSIHTMSEVLTYEELSILLHAILEMKMKSDKKPVIVRKLLEMRRLVAKYELSPI